MWEFEDKINPFFMPVCFSCGSREESIGTGESLVENGNEIVFEHDFELIVRVILPVKGFEQSSRVGLRGKEKQIMPAV